MKKMTKVISLALALVMCLALCACGSKKEASYKMLDEKVSTFVLDRPETRRFLSAWHELLDSVMPGYVAEGKPRLSIAVGCTGGQHRSVALAVETARYLASEGYQVQLSHRYLPRANAR